MNSASFLVKDFSTVKVGVTVLIYWQQHLLLAKRQGSHGSGTWDSPGGHLDPGESVRDCAVREVSEETGIKIFPHSVLELGFTEDFFYEENKHYISCVVACEVNGNAIKPVLTEPHKFSTPWQWHVIYNLPQPLFIPLKNALDKFNEFIFKKEC